jgi:outer membrane protein
MKTIKVLSITLLTFISAFTFSQSKIGHINTNELLKQMPEVMAAQEKVEALNKQYQETIEKMVAEYTEKRKVLSGLMDDPNTPKAVLEDKQTELIQMEERIQNFQEKAEQESMAKQKELLEPVLEKVQNIIDEVAKEKGYNYILDTSTGMVLFADEADDITPFVKEKLGLTGTVE